MTKMCAALVYFFFKHIEKQSSVKDVLTLKRFIPPQGARDDYTNDSFGRLGIFYTFMKAVCWLKR